MKYTQLDLSLEDIDREELLSKRPVTLCRNHGLLFLSEIVEYYNRNFNFKSITNCGKTSNNELIAFSRNYVGYVFPPNEDRLRQDIVEEIKSLSVYQKFLLDKQFDAFLSAISERAKSALQSMALDYTDLPILIFLLQKGKKPTLLLRNVGVKTAKELETLRLDVIRFINRLHSIHEKDSEIPSQ